MGRKRSGKEASGPGVSREVRQGREGKATDEGYVKPAATIGDQSFILWASYGKGKNSCFKIIPPKS